MKGKFFLAVLFCLFAFFTTQAQNSFKVIEAETQLVLDTTTARISLVVISPDETESTAKIEFLNPKGEVKASAEKDFKLTKGANRLEMPISVSEIVRQEDFALYRLHYVIGNVVGTISVFQIAGDIFDLEALAVDLLPENGVYTVRVRAIQPIKLNGVKNVKLKGELQIEFDDNQQTTLELAAETDADGFADLEFQLPKYTKVQDLDLKISGDKNGITNEISKNLPTSNFERDSFLYFQTDKPIYQPSQKLRLRTLFFDAEKKAIADENLTFSIKDEDDTTIQKLEAKTSRFGVATVEWEIPENAKLGEYRIVAESQRELAYNQRYFKVSRYDLPNFVVNAKPDRNFYLPENKTAAVTVRADYLFGKPLTKAKVRVVREVERKWNFKLQKYETKDGETKTGELDDDGNFVTDFDLSTEHKDYEEDSWEKFKDLRFAAYVTDLTTNRTEQHRFDVRLTKKPIHVYLIGETRNLSKRLPPKFYVTTFYADGTPAVCDVKIFQAHPDSDEDKPKAGKLLVKLKTNSFGAAKIAVPLSILDEDDEDLDLVIGAKDAQGNQSLTSKDLNFDNGKPAVQIETDKIVYRAGETVKVSVVSSLANEVLYLDVKRNWQTLLNEKVRLVNGRAVLEIPYRDSFKNALTFAVYGSYRDDGNDIATFADNKTIVFPSPFGLRVEANSEKDILRPGEETTVDLTARKMDGTANETAFGVVVLDKAIEERARTDGDSDSGYRSFYSDLENLLGYTRGFGGISGFDVDNLDTSKSLTPEAELAIEIAVRRDFFTNIEDSGSFLRKLHYAYQPVFAEQFKALKDALNRRYSQDALTPTDEASLRKILALDGLNFDSYVDAWGNPFRADFSRSQKNIELSISSAGADEKFGTNDDITALNLNFQYFYETGRKIDQAFADYRERTDDFIRDYKTLRQELRRQNFNLDDLRDGWGKRYRFDFVIENSNYVLKITGGGWDKKIGGFNDFTIWTNTVDYFTATRANISREFRHAVAESQRFPIDEASFRTILKQSGFDLDTLKDVFGRNYYVEKEQKFIYADKLKINPPQKSEVTPVTQEYVTFYIKSAGRDGATKTADDFELVRFVGIISEKTKDVLIDGNLKTVPSSSANRGAIAGKIVDVTGSVIAGAKITAVWNPTQIKFETNSDENGRFTFSELPQGVYELTFDSAGFKKTILQSVFVQSSQLTELEVRLEVGSVSETVSVTSDAEVINTTDAQMSVTITQSQVQELPLNGRAFSSFYNLAPGVVSNGQKGKITVVTKSGVPAGENQTEQPIETPRLREYFPETLLWSPEIIADQNGRAQIKFKLADSLTTWKIGVIASTLNGDVGIAEKEIKTFQPFFADLDPPKFLTVGDEISLPVQIRNYTEKAQKVDVTMANGDWFNFLDAANKQIEVAANDSQNAVFGFRADKIIKDGKQRVTATAGRDSDAIEKSVTVKPNGREIVVAKSEIFRESAAFDVNFPADALPNTPKAELKIYPNLLAHVAESIEGLLKRPYGCGEQTISSTYPNLMILKFAPKDGKIRAQAAVYLQKGYERLLGYQAADGGFSVWTKDAPDVALTGYALRFLNDAKDYIAVDEDVIKRARTWLIKQQRADGSWTRQYNWEKVEDGRRTKLMTSYAARTLAMIEKSAKDKDKESETALRRGLEYLKTRNAEIDEPYSLALFGLASLDAGNFDDAKTIAAKLETTAINEGAGAYWNLETNTPFYGWGTAGRIETTALVVHLLTQVQSFESKVQNQTEARDSNNKALSEGQRTKNDGQTADLISKGTQFLLKNKDRYGVWYSTQTTINVLDAFLASIGDGGGVKAFGNRTAEIFVNNQKLKDVTLPPENAPAFPINVDLPVNSAENRVEVKIAGNKSATMAQIVETHYVGWQNYEANGRSENQSRALRMAYDCDKHEAKPTEEITCKVEAERIGFKGYGMLLAEIGLPPGADVDRASLEKAKEENWNFSRYDVLPDRLIVYLWAQAGGAKFDFKFKPRYGINAQTAPSIVYDYYNPEAQATVAPLKFTVK